MVAGGGVRGKENGTVRGAMMPVGATIAGVRLFIEAYLQVGGMTTGKIGGEGVNGINKESPTIKFKKTGGHGKEISTGRNKIIGVSGARISPKNHGNRLEKFSSHNSETMKEEEIRKTGFLKEIFRM
jgi:hypothetical protein